jgi:hypothetical protein
MNHLNQLHRQPLWRGVVLAMLMMAGPLRAQSVPESDHLVYQMQPGDTLLGLVNKHMQSPDALKQLIQANRLTNVNRISVGQKIQIPRRLLKHIPSTATVTRLNCKTVILIDGNAASPIKAGSILGEGAVLRIPAGCQFALTLEDESTLRLMSGAVIQIKTLRRNPLEASPEVKVELLDGRMEIDVPRKRLSNDAPFQVLTPTSVAGVRGTEFRVGFDAKQRTSQVEVKVGAVGARGGLEKSEKRTETGQGLAVMANGQSLDVEKLLMPPRYVSGEVQTGGKDWLLKFESPPQAERFWLVTADDANFGAILSEAQPTQAQVLAPDLSSKSVFYQWASISATGLMGQSQDYAVCKGYKRLDQWRCNVPMNMTGLVNPTLLFQKVEEQGRVIELLNGPVESASNNVLVFRGLPVGVYRWRIQHEVSATMKANINGQFELVAIPGAE